MVVHSGRHGLTALAARLVQGLGAGIYFPAISATIQRLFTGRDRSRAFGYLDGVVGISIAAGPLLGGLLIQGIGTQDGWRRVFLVNLFIGAAELPVAIKLLPRRQGPEEHKLDPFGNVLLVMVLLLLLVPLVDGRVSGWPAWSWLLLSLVFPAVAVLASWERRLYRRHGEPVVQVGLMRHRSFWAGQCLALTGLARGIVELSLLTRVVSGSLAAAVAVKTDHQRAKRSTRYL